MVPLSKSCQGVPQVGVFKDSRAILSLKSSHLFLPLILFAIRCPSIAALLSVNCRAWRCMPSHLVHVRYPQMCTLWVCPELRLQCVCLGLVQASKPLVSGPMPYCVVLVCCVCGRARHGLEKVLRLSRRLGLMPRVIAVTRGRPAIPFAGLSVIFAMTLFSQDKLQAVMPRRLNGTGAVLSSGNGISDTASL